ncbi:hypothetical protein KVR01_012296 [Diaporthe batatas]|uniref:uncharacterized protein n=1 Tax=Diaporthe batatas TaxID=748121 RepID=UPI001D049AD4|nr:uncharacterized protein KVR01_012296 [Diaporthe batatas]KAG8158024.1 hypothetical protein KVR01_012296 [Diaporthe batatas]
MAPESMQPTETGNKHSNRKRDGQIFEFVVDTCATHNGAARALVRRQAARSGARLRKTRATKTGASSGHEESSSAREAPNTKSETLQRGVTPSRLGSVVAGAVKQPTFSAYEATRVIYNFDVTSLESFLNVDMPVAGSSFNSMIQDCLQQSAALIRTGDPSSFLTHLPARYGSSPFLDDAVHCVAARAAQALGRSKTTTPPSLLYGKALRSLKNGIQLGSCADVYCATRLFVLYESLGDADVNALIFHNKAGIELLRRIGPPTDPNSFDCMLIKSQGPQVMVFEIHEKQSSMFEAPRWQNFFDDAACRARGRDARFWWRFFGTVCFLPGILRDARNLFCTQSLDSFEYMSKNLSILQRVEKLFQTLLIIHEEYKQAFGSQRTLSLWDLPDPSGVESPDRVRLRLFLHFPSMFLCRLRASLSLSEADRAASEEEAQRTAAQALHVEKLAKNANPNMAWHYAQRNSLPYSIIRTREDWLPISERGQNWEELKIYLAERWLKWDNSWHDTVLVKELGEGRSEEGTFNSGG